MGKTLSQIAQAVGARVLGDESVVVSGVASLESAKPCDLVFVEDGRNLPAALQSQAAAIITGKANENYNSTKPLLISEQPRLAFARAAALLSLGKCADPWVHPSAIVHVSASLGKNVSIGAHSTIDENVTLGDETRIGPGCHIGRGVQIGARCSFLANVTIYPGAQIGSGVVVHAGAVLGSDGFGYVCDTATGRYEKFPQIGKLIIEDNVEIGANSTVDRGALDVTRIGRGTKIDNLVHVGHNVLIGEDVVIAAQTGISGSSVLENGVIVGGQVGIADHVRIESGAILGAQSGIPTKKIIRGKGVVFWGTPARPIREYLKELAVLARLAKK